LGFSELDFISLAFQYHPARRQPCRMPSFFPRGRTQAGAFL
jgi:hypothetical protein